MMARQETDTIQQFNSIKQDILSGDIKPFYLLFGKEHYYIDEICNVLIDNVLQPEEKDFGQLILYGADVNVGQVISTARQFPMMASKQLVVVKEAQMMKNVDEIAIYLKAPMPTTVLVICYKSSNDPTKSSKSIDKRTSFYKEAQNKGVAFESVPISDFKITRWIENFILSKNLCISPEAAALLAEYAGTDLQKISLEVDKLIKVLPHGSKDISVEDIELNVGISRDYSAFELAKSLSFKDAVKCFKIVNFFADSSKRFPFQMTLGALSAHFIKILKYHALVENGIPRSELASSLGVNPYFMGEYDAAYKNYPLKKCMKIIALLKEYDYKNKSNAGGNASDGDLLLELTSKIINS